MQGALATPVQASAPGRVHGDGFRPAASRGARPSLQSLLPPVGIPVLIPDFTCYKPLSSSNLFFSSELMELAVRSAGIWGESLTIVLISDRQAVKLLLNYFKETTAMQTLI